MRHIAPSALCTNMRKSIWNAMLRCKYLIPLALFLLIGIATILGFVQLLQLWAVRTPQVEEVRVAGTPIDSISWSPDSSHVAGGFADGTVVSWNMNNHQRQVISSEDDQIDWKVRWSPDGSLLASLSHRQLTIWDTTTWAPIDQIDLESHFGADPQSLVAWSAQNVLSLGNLSYESSRYRFQLETWDITKPGSVLAGELEGLNFAIWAIEWSHRGDRLTVGSEVFDGESFGERLAILAVPSPLKSVAWSPDDSFIATASLFDFGLITICDSATGQAIIELPERMSTIETVSWSSDGNWLAAGGYWTHNGTNLGSYSPGKYDIDRGAIYVWNARIWKKSDSHTWTGVPVTDVQFSPDSRYLAVALGNGQILLFDPSSGRQLDTLE